MPKQKQGSNPVTLRVEGKAVVASIMRMGLGTVDNMRHTVSIAISNVDNKKVIGFVQVPEDRFIDTIGRLFPRGELDGANMEEGPEDRAELEREQDALQDLTRDGPTPFPAKSSYNTAMARIERINEIFTELDKQ